MLIKEVEVWKCLETKQKSKAVLILVLKSFKYKELLTSPIINPFVLIIKATSNVL